MVSLESVWLLGCSLVGVSYILNGYVDRESWSYMRGERKYPYLLIFAQTAAFVLGGFIILGVIGHLMINGGNV